MPELTGTKDLRAYLKVLWRWKWLFLFIVIAAPTVAYVIDRAQTPLYQSSTLVGINTATLSTPSVSGSGSFSTSNITAIAELITTTPVADVAAGLMNPPASPGQIAGEVSATADPTTDFLTISAQDRSPVRAAQIANAFAKAISLNLTQSALAQLNGSIKVIDTQLKHLAANDPARAALEQQRAQLVAARLTQGGQAAVLQPATPASAPVGGGARRTVEIGLVIGLLLGFGAVVLAESADRKLRTPEDLENMTELPLLAVIEPSAFSAGLTSSKEDDEAFQMLRTALMYFNVDRHLDSVLITSAGEKEGKTTVATRLAVAAASSGLNVILVDADLRRANAAKKLGISADEGLGAVIAGACTLSDALVEQPLDNHLGDGHLRVLPAGSPPPNPSALMSSPRMQEVLRQLESDSDLVIVDTPAALAVSDPVPLMRSVSGIVIVARMNRSSRLTLRRLQKIIHSAQGNLMGVVATDATPAPGESHYYPAYYGHNGSHNGSTRIGRLLKKKTAGSSVGSSEPDD